MREQWVSFHRPPTISSNSVIARGAHGPVDP